MTQKNTFRIVARGSDGSLQMRDYPEIDPLAEHYDQIGVDDCSTDLALRGMPVFRGLIGPMPEGKNIVRYETPEVFEMLTKEWGISKPKQRRARTRKPERANNPVIAVEAETDPSPSIMA
ncbi:hypothetical protein [Allorhodopirellula heiligendammensis]|uniref:Uncharacterized protein n=1 Tax=Allorhodopirellula heiligendammensis TaxID=2714739 RepID=A0A5C6C5Q8_9BACT|nr:hypothetical protein [Allorhodopirellula heiligendammensis]TWU18684.1 hypothetical protein Poly21_08490 [Allorhodopirellula heiligendammensis]